MHAAFLSRRTGRVGRAGWSRDRGMLLLLGALLLGFGVAFANGGYGQTAAAVSVVGAILLAVATTALIAGGAEAMLPRGDAARGTALFAAFAVWSLASVAWSVRPDRSLAWGALVAGYALILLTAVAAARVSRRSRGATVLVLLAGAVAVAAVSILQRLGGDAAVAVLGGLDNARRLSGPLDYWNALGLVAAVGILVAGRLALDPGRRAWVRAALGALLPPLAGVVLLSQSRGALLALAIGVVVVGVTSGSSRLRLPVLIGATFAAALPMALTGAGRVSGDAIVTHSGTTRVVGAIVLGAALGALVVIAMRALEPRIVWPAVRTRWVVRGGAALLVVAVLAGGAAYSVQQGGVGEALDSVVQRVASTDEVAPVAGAGRLLSVSSSNRASWWAEAVGAWAERPAEGWGASTFGTVRKRFRTDAAEVNQPHSLPLQVLAETGIVGFLLLAGALWLLLRAGVRRLRDLPPGRQRTLQAVLLGVVGAWLVQASVDWDMDLPGVTVPVLVALGVAAAAPVTRGTGAVATPRETGSADGEHEHGAPSDAAPPPAAIPMPERLRPRPQSRVALFAATLLGGIGLAVITVVPVVGEGVADRAQSVLSGETSPAELVGATRDVALAADLDPFSLRPLEIGRIINVRRDRLLEARRLALRETRRQPDNPQSWIGLAEVAGGLADRVGMRAAAQRAIRLDPNGIEAVDLLAEANGQLAPPGASPTATGTPLPRPAQAP